MTKADRALPIERAGDAVQRCDGALQILQAASELFAMHGYDGTSINDIAQRAGLCKANVFHHFASKETLYHAVLKRASVRTVAEVEQIVDGDGSYARKLHQLLRLNLLRMLEKPGAMQLILRESFEHGQTRGRELAEQVFRHTFSAELSLFTKAQQAGEFRSDLDPMLCWMGMVGTALFYFQGRHMLRYHPEFQFDSKPELFAEHLSELLLRGMQSVGEGGR